MRSDCNSGFFVVGGGVCLDTPLGRHPQTETPSGQTPLYTTPLHISPSSFPHPASHVDRQTWVKTLPSTLAVGKYVKT